MSAPPSTMKGELVGNDAGYATQAKRLRHSESSCIGGPSHGSSDTVQWFRCSDVVASNSRRRLVAAGNGWQCH